jgi:hypothetical protein
VQVLTHRDYFRRFRLSVEQYGEILVAAAFRGEKMGDSQRGFDVRISTTDFIEVLKGAMINAGQAVVEKMVSPSFGDEIRLEVKSKVSKTNSGGVAYVVHCNESKFEDRTSKNGIQKLAMTHLAVIIVNPASRLESESDEKGTIQHAWLMTREMAADLRKMKSQSK